MRVKVKTWFHGKQGKRSYIAQYPILRIAQSALHFTSLTDLFNQTLSQLIWVASSHMLQLMREGCSYAYSPLSVARYSFTQLSVNWSNVKRKNLSMILTQQNRIRTRVLLVESPRSSTAEPLRSTYDR